MLKNQDDFMEIIKKIKELKNNKEFSEIVDKRIKEFENINDCNEIFKELCFCLMTANFNAEKCIYIQKNIGSGFFDMDEKKLLQSLKSCGHRFPNKRTEYILEARKMKNIVCEKIKELDEFSLREWLVENIKGLGYKEASHFLRNIGFKNMAIVDFHIVDILERNDLIEKPKTMTKKRYLEIEDVLRDLSKKVSLSLSELDLYLWYLETGKILK